MTKQDIEDLKSRVDIVELVSSYGVELKRSGRNYKALCPFHEEKTASFTINVIKKTFTCYGCHKSGDVISFVMENDGLSFADAVKKLASRYGIALSGGKTSDVGQNLTKQYLLLSKIAEYFHQSLVRSREKDTLKEYLNTRQITPVMVDLFNVGYVPDSSNAIINWAVRNGFSKEDLRESGIVMLPDELHAGYYNRFGGRLAFPIYDRIGRVVGFSCRLIRSDENAAKYINSPESEVFHKRNVLFGLNHALPLIARKEIRQAIVCEGQIDVIRCHANGFKTAVAGLGTSFTKEHVKLLKPLVDSVILAFDGDSAGQKAVETVGGLFIEENIWVNVAVLPEKDDPDSFIQKNGRDAFKCIVDTSPSLINYIVRKRLDNVSPAKRTKEVFVLSHDIIALIKRCGDAVIRDLMLKEAAESLDLPYETLESGLSDLNVNNSIDSWGPKLDTGTLDYLYVKKMQKIERAIYELLDDNAKSGDGQIVKIMREGCIIENIVSDDLRRYIGCWFADYDLVGGKDLGCQQKPVALMTSSDTKIEMSDRAIVDTEISPNKALQELLRRHWIESVKDYYIEPHLRAKDETVLAHREAIDHMEIARSGVWEEFVKVISQWRQRS